MCCVENDNRYLDCRMATLWQRKLVSATIQKKKEVASQATGGARTGGVEVGSAGYMHDVQTTSDTLSSTGNSSLEENVTNTGE